MAFACGVKLCDLFGLLASDASRSGGGDTAVPVGPGALKSTHSNLKSNSPYGYQTYR